MREKYTKKGNENKEKISTRTLLIVLFAALFVFSGAKVISGIMEDKAAENAYGDIENEFLKDDDPTPVDPQDTDPVDPEGPQDEDPEAPDDPQGTDTPEDPTQKDDPEKKEETETTPKTPDYDPGKQVFTDDRLTAQWQEAKASMGFTAKFPAVDFDKMAEVNKDIFGWIFIPDTNVSFPLLQGTDNEYYLTHSYKKEPLAAGSIMLDCRCSKKLSGQYTLIWGHRKRNGTMFGQMENFYGDAASAKSHKYLYILLKDGTMHVYQFHSYITGDVNSIMLDFSIPVKEKVPQVIEYASGRNKAHYTTDISAEDKLLVIACCVKGRNPNHRYFFTYKEIYNGSYLNW